MNLERFLARRLHKSEKNNRRVSRPAVIIAEAGVALGLCVMIITICVSLGFKHEIRSKVIGFNSHIHVSSFESATSYESTPIVADDSLCSLLSTLEGVERVQRYATKPGLFRVGDEFLGFVLKGVGEEYDFSFFSDYLKEGSVDSVLHAQKGNQVLVSRIMADKLDIHVGDRLETYFIENTIRARRLTVCGIYDTGFGDFDELFALTDLGAVQSLNRWDSTEVAGVEIGIDDYDELSLRAYEIGRTLDEYGNAHSTSYFVQTIEEQNPNLFAWLDVLNVNVWVILLLMLGVAGFTVISGLLILILEKTQFIGVLKALGSPNVSIRKVFLWLSAYIIGRGMLWGNIIGLGLCAIQKYTGLIPLDPKNYYLDCVPIEFNWPLLILLNVGMLVASVAMLIIPSQLVSKIYPSRVLQFE